MKRLLVLVLALLPSFVLAQTTGKIAGRVVDTATGVGIPGANIVVLGTPRGASSDLDGNYFVLNVEPGVYTLIASFVGYETKRVEGVRVGVDRTATVNFSMAEDNALTQEVVIQANKNLVEVDRTSSSAKIGGEQIAALPVDSFLETIGLQAGVTKGAGGELHIRGGRSSEVKYYVDGVAVSNPFNNSMASPVENSAVQEVEVISGTFNAEYGQANSGIVNVVTKSGSEKFTGSFNLSGGGYFSGREGIFPDIGAASPLGQKRFEGSISGPTGIKNLTFFLNTGWTDYDNYLGGRRVFMPSDSSNFSGRPDTWRIQATGDSAYVPMNPTNGLTNLLKLTYQLSRDIKLSYSASRNWYKSQSYSHFYRLNPEARPTLRSLSYNHLLVWNQVLNARTFFNVRLTYYTTDLSQYVYEDPQDERYRYIYGRGIQPGNVFNTGGVDRSHIRRDSDTYAARFDITRQIGQSHLVKAGVEYRYNRLFSDEFQLLVDPRQFGTFEPQIPDLSSTLHNQYTRHPIEAALFIQDKIEIKDLIVNVGLRYDYFDPNAKVPTDLKDPQNTLRPRPEAEAYREATIKMQVSPRLGFAFPITETGVIHASYGHFFQIPEYGRMYENPDFKVALGNFNTFMGNADLEPQRSTIYELGLQQQLGQNLAIDVTAYYRDVRNLIGAKLYRTYTGSDSYGRYENADFGSVRGLTASLQMVFPAFGIRGGINYTYQSARGNASDPRQAFYDAQGNNEAARSLIPLDWDLQHSLNGDLTWNQGGWSAGIIGEFKSGYPFTPTDVQRNPIVEQRNGARYQPEFRLDLRAGRDFKLGDLRAQIFIFADNLLDAYRPDRYPRLFQTEIEAHRANGLEVINTLKEFRTNPAVQPSPRMIRLGMMLDF
ncbi:MAG: TonB-dependent receptor [Bacteroidetes Order II. Incertae sedis bacterium]|nr:TonB-dependent receptor [Bacteroidetes Order II. bacterium]